MTVSFPYLGHGLGKVRDDFVFVAWFERAPDRALQAAVDERLGALAGVPRTWRVDQQQLVVWMGDVELETMIKHNPDIDEALATAEAADAFGVDLGKLEPARARLLAFRAELTNDVAALVDHGVTCALELHPYMSRFKGSSIHRRSLDHFDVYLRCFEHSLARENPKQTVRSGEMTTHRIFSSFCHEYVDKKLVEKWSADRKEALRTLIARARPGCRNVPFGERLDTVAALLR